MKLQSALCVVLSAALVFGMLSCEKTAGTNPEYTPLGRTKLSGKVDTIDFLPLSSTVAFMLRDDKTDSLYYIDFDHTQVNRLTGEIYEYGQSTIDTNDFLGPLSKIVRRTDYPDPDSEYVSILDPKPVTIHLTSSAERDVKFDLGVREVEVRITSETVIQWGDTRNNRTLLLRTDSTSRAQSEQYLENEFLGSLGRCFVTTPALPYNPIVLTVTRANR